MSIRKVGRHLNREKQKKLITTNKFEPENNDGDGDRDSRKCSHGDRDNDKNDDCRDSDRDDGKRAAMRRQSAPRTTMTAEMTAGHSEANRRSEKTRKMTAAKFVTNTTTAAAIFMTMLLEIGVEITGHGTNVGLVSFNNK